MSFELDDLSVPAGGNDKGFAPGFTAFTTVAGLDILMRTRKGESKGRLATLNEDGTLSGSMYEPEADESSNPIHLTAEFSKDLSAIRLTMAGKRPWILRIQPKGHFFGHMNQWPTKAEPADNVNAMLEAMRARRSQS